jgi:membrane protease YdiL (CAAX protease family)
MTEQPRPHDPWMYAAPTGYPVAPPADAGTGDDAGPRPFWPTSPEWMELDPGRPARWGLPDVLMAIAAFIVGSFLVAAGIVVGGMLATGESPVEFARLNSGLISIAGLVGSWIAVIAFLVLIVHLKGQGSLRRDFGLSFSWWDPLIGAGAAVVTLLLSQIVQTVVAAASGVEAKSNAEAIFGNLLRNKPLLLVMAAMASVGAPLVEETLFRGLALRAIEKRFGGVAAVAGSSILFGALHYQVGMQAWPSLVAGLAVYGVVFAVLTRWWGRLGPAVFAHIWLNSLATIVVLAPVLTK